MNIRVGIRPPPRCTAVGKVLLAALSPEELELLTKRMKLRFTARTIVSPELTIAKAWKMFGRVDILVNKRRDP